MGDILSKENYMLKRSGYNGCTPRNNPCIVEGYSSGATRVSDKENIKSDNDDNNRLNTNAVVLSGSASGEGTGRVSWDTLHIDIHIRAFQTRDSTAHVMIAYLLKPNVELDSLIVYQIEGSYNASNFDEYGEPLEYVNSKDFSNLSEGDFSDTWFSCNQNKSYYFYALGKTWFDGVMWWTAYRTGSFTSILSLSSPSNLSFNSSNGRLSFSCSASGKRIVEFERTDGYNPTGKTNNQKLLFYLSSLINLENGYDGYYSSNYSKLHRWSTGKHSIGVRYKSSVPTSKESTLFYRVTNAVSKINSALNGSGVSFEVQTNGSGEIIVDFGTHEELWGWTPNISTGWYNGTWETYTNSSGYITGANVKLRWDEVWHGTFDAVTLEELVECLGCGFDQVELPYDTIFSEFIYLDKPDYISTDDQAVIDILYKNNLTVNKYHWEIAKQINIPKGCKDAGSNNYLDLTFLEPNKNYRARVWVINSYGQISETTEWYNFTTPNIPSAPSAPSVNSRFDGGLVLKWNSVTNATSYTLQYKRRYDTTWTETQVTSTTKTLTGLSYAVNYDFRVKSNGAFGSSDYSTTSSAHTLPKKPTISATNITHSSVTIKVDALPDNCDKVQVECYVYAGGGYSYHSMKSIDPIGRTFPTAQTVTFTGLDRGWSYRFFAVSAYDANGDGTGTGTWLESYPSNEVTVSTLNRPDDWVWTTNFYSGKEFTVYYDTENYYYIMPATEWNDFLAKINEFRVYKDLSTVSFPTYAKNNYFAATVYNQAVSAINAMSAYFIGYTTIPTKSSGSELTAADFFRIRDTLNSIE